MKTFTLDSQATTAAQVAEEATRFLEGRFPDLETAGDYIEIRSREEETGEWKRRWFASAREAGEYATSLDSQGDEVFYGVNPRRFGEGNKAGVTRLLALHADVDAKAFATKEEAYQALLNAPLEPSLIVDSGGGWHAYWQLSSLG